MSEVATGYKIQKNGLILEVREYSGDRAWCYCSGCGSVVPALEHYTKEALEKWFDLHIALFPKEHSEK
ncbi:MAG: hypothetical protein ACRD38_01285 [Nitrososphaerales archaeon]